MIEILKFLRKLRCKGDLASALQSIVYENLQAPLSVPFVPYCMGATWQYLKSSSEMDGKVFRVSTAKVFSCWALEIQHGE